MKSVVFVFNTAPHGSASGREELLEPEALRDQLNKFDVVMTF